MQKIEKYLAVFICIAVCVQRLSMAIGSICWGISIALSLYLLHYYYKNKQLKELAKNFKGYYIAFGIFAICILPSLYFSSDFKDGIKDYAEMCIYRMTPFFMVTLFIQNKTWLRNIFLVFLFATGIDSVVAVGQLMLGYSSRGWGFGGNTLNLASLLCIVIPILLIIILDSHFSEKTKNICKIILVLCIGGLLAGKSRGAWLTVAIVAPLVSGIYIIKSKKAIIVTLAVLVGLGTFFANSDTFKNRLVSTANVTTDSSNVERILIWKSCIRMIEDYPVLGVGLGEFKNFYDNGYQEAESKVSLVHAHNNILQICVESGLVGLFGFLYLAFYIFVKNLIDWRKDKNPYSLMIWGAWLAFMSFGMFDLTMHHSAVTKAMWFLFGCILVFKNRRIYI
ncbi:MAG: hypothetical protein DBY32_10935 [Phascolarctobacterium sp.]|nr:MAG: hypothetical protein DBY32_10935 [Phascolarctobacterium sp.]